jgi:DnaJ-class molecular chaperone
MRCETCHGTGYRCEARMIPGTQTPAYYLNQPCPDCNGTGEAHCCDGIVEQPQPDKGQPCSS